MNQIKRITGLIWILLAVVAYAILLQTALTQINAKPSTDTIIQWSIFAMIFLPIAIGLIIFGWLALKGDYDQLPVSSEGIQD
ncbi:MAG: DUF6814 family protein [Bacteroidota bacterium]|jgi:hypothetical protein|nr:hypothetical protein [Chitinophagaceae bacterium]MCE2758007.1 hypothetical protein [Chitinophagaceae bacterium]